MVNNRNSSVATSSHIGKDGRSNAAFEHEDQRTMDGASGRARRPRQREVDTTGFSNVAFQHDDDTGGHQTPSIGSVESNVTPPPPYPVTEVLEATLEAQEGTHHQPAAERATWGNPIEFLMSCIAMSVGLGNVWRFSYVAYNNGGGAFLIPYLIVLLFIGKPLYFLEMALGQFSSYGSVRIWEVVPILKGVGYGQALATWFVVTYYCVLIAICFFYFFSSFQAILPWTLCDSSWASFASCYNSSTTNLTELDLNVTGAKSSSALFFSEEVMKSIDTLENGIGAPDWRLSLCLLFAWIVICAIMMKGPESSGKVAYFTALFPYVVLLTLLIRGVTLEGASDGILYFLRPDWPKLANPNTWYAAVTQCFFSLSVGFGPIVMFSSYNQFRQNIYRDAMIISLMDTFTSFLAGITVFSILGNLAHESGVNVSAVVAGGPGLAFVSYPDAIAKFDVVPQLFAVLFFLMMLTLGVGSATSLVGCVITIICDDFPHFKRWLVTAVVSAIGFFCGLVYITPGGLLVLDIVDYFGAGFIIFLMVILEVIGVCWIYGLNRFIRDVDFMLNVKLGVYWKLTWAYIIPITLLVIFVYAMSQYDPTLGGKYVFPPAATGAGWFLAIIAILQVPIWGIYVVCKQEGDTWMERLRTSFKATHHWGPMNPVNRLEWKKYQREHVHKPHLWLPRCPSRSTYDVSTSNTDKNDNVHSNGRPTNGTAAPNNDRRSWGGIENEIAS